MKIFQKKKFDIKEYEIKFVDNFDDLVDKFLFSKKYIIKNVLSASEEKLSSLSLERLIFRNGELNFPLLSMALSRYYKLRNNADDIKIRISLERSVKGLIEICGDKPIDEYSRIDSDDYLNHFVKSNKISAGRKNQSNLINIFKLLYSNLYISNSNPFLNFKWPDYKHKTRKIFSDNELKLIFNFCKEKNDFVSIIIALMFDTGCLLSEIIGLFNDDIFLSSHQNYLVIRSNYLRKIKKRFSKRVVPLVGISLWAAKKIKLKGPTKNIFSDFLSKGTNKIYILEYSINKLLKSLTNGKTSYSFRLTLINRLKNINCPEEVILEILGKSKESRIYNNESSLEYKSSWLEQIIFKT